MGFMLSAGLRKCIVFLIFTKIITISTCIFAEDSNSFQAQVKALEASLQGGRIGVAAINTENQQELQYRADEAFPFQSTFKVMVAADILQQSTSNSSLLKQNIKYTKKDLVTWSPITAKYLADGMTIAALSRAAIAYSDNTAANLLIQQLGGVNAVNAFAQSIGNTAFKLEHIEPNLNSNPKDSADTVTPVAMAQSLQKLVFGDSLPALQQTLLVTWMKGNQTGDHRIRAALPKNWLVADKTGSGDYGITNDIGVIWPPNCSPLILTIYVVQNDKQAPEQEAVVTSVTKLVLQQFSLKDACLKKALGES